jgi:hypothetical protein
MEQELMDFDEWIKIQQTRQIVYAAVYNDEGNITSVGPDHSFNELTNKLEIDDDIALAILDGRETMFSYKVDIRTKTFLKVSNFLTHSLTKIDDVLHRIIDSKWSTVSNSDISITHDIGKSTLIFSINLKYKKLILEGDTEMNFLLTEYNDPNILLGMISFRVGDLVSQDKVCNVNLPTKFSIYTRRIFDTYIFKTL